MVGRSPELFHSFLFQHPGLAGTDSHYQGLSLIAAPGRWVSLPGHTCEGPPCLLAAWLCHLHCRGRTKQGFGRTAGHFRKCLFRSRA